MAAWRLRFPAIHGGGRSILTPPKAQFLKDLWQEKKWRGWAEQREVPSSRTQEHEIEYAIIHRILIRCARNFLPMGLGAGRMHAYWTCHANRCELAMNRERMRVTYTGAAVLGN
jgi:hypothetical protein